MYSFNGVGMLSALLIIKPGPQLFKGLAMRDYMYVLSTPKAINNQWHDMV